MSDRITYRDLGYDKLLSRKSKIDLSDGINESNVDAIISDGSISGSTIDNNENWSDDVSAEAAQAAADAAQADATANDALLDDIASDSKITPVEKLTIKPLWDAIIAEKTDIDTQADTYSVSKTAYGTAYTNLNTYLNTTITVFVPMTDTTTIVRADWDSNWEAYYNAKIEILQAIADATALLADWNSVSNKPASLYQFIYQATAPTSGMSTGDYWVDSDDNKVYRYNGTSWVEIQDADIASAISDAANAQSTADGKVYVYKQTTAPTGMVAGDVGDLWLDTDDGNKLYRYSGSAWEEVQDDGIVTAITNAATAQSAADTAQADATQAISDAAGAQGTADGKVTTFYQTTAPTAEGVGDLWIDTDDTNKLYRWSGSAWTSVVDSDIAQAISNAATAQSTADGKIVTFIQTTAPTAEGTGDFWIDSDDNNKPYRWSGSAWVAINNPSEWADVLDGATTKPVDNATDDTAADAAQATALSKAKIFRQDTAPASGMTAGDIWIDTNDGDRPYSYNGSNWVETLTVIDGGKITTGTIDASVVTVNNLVAGNITTGTMNAARIDGGDINGVTITGVTITGGTIQTATTGQRIVIGDNTIDFWDSSNNSCGQLLGWNNNLHIAGANVYIVASLKLWGILEMEEYPIFGNTLPNKWCWSFDNWGEESVAWRGWRETGTNEADNFLQPGSYLLETGALVNDYVQTYAANNTDWALNWNKNPLFQVFAKFGSTTSQESYIGMGAEINGFGFDVSDGVLSAVVYTASTGYKTTITGITLTDFNTYRADYDYGTNIKFYVNNVLKHTQTTNLPTTNNTTTFQFYIKTTTTAARKLFIRNLRILADN